MKKRIFQHPKYEKLKKILVSKLGIMYYWTYSKNFSIDKHIIVVDDNIQTYEELNDYVAALITKKMDKT